MRIKRCKIRNIPAILWGEDSSNLIIAAHGNKSSKEDDCIKILAEEAVPLGYQVLSFDFPKHGERVEEMEPCMVQECVKELKEILEYGKEKAERISIFGCSMGAYFSLLAYREEKIEHAIFLSPVTDMERLIRNIMKWANITVEQLQKEKTVPNSIETLYWDYYCYVKEHPITSWEHPTSILYGEYDNLSEFESVSGFAKEYACDLEVHKGGEHWFHTEEELEYYRAWMRKSCNILQEKFSS